jgi:general stress protein YciG
MAGNTSKRGFASMDKDKQRAIAAAGGRASGGNFARNRKRARIAGKRGGENSHRKRQTAAVTG